MSVAFPTDGSPVPLRFVASFSADARLIAPCRDLAVKVAASLEYSASDAAEVGHAVGEAMSRAVETGRVERIEVMFRTEAGRFEVTVDCDGKRSGHITRALPGELGT